MSGTNEAGNRPMELRPAAPADPDLPPGTIIVSTDHPVTADPAAGQHRRTPWRHAFDLDGWGLPPMRRWPRAVHTWAGQPIGRLAVPGILTVVLLALTAAAGLYLVPAAARSSSTAAAEPTASGDAPATSAPPLVPPPLDPIQTTPPPPNGVGRPADVFATWAQQMSGCTEIPATAMQAYGYAEWVMSQQAPNCRLTWPTLAAIGKVESNHGRANSAVLTSDGRAYPLIYGPALDGQSGRELIRDTDLGNLDRDPTYDRAVGPMQFIPSTWQLYQVDADDDTARDPHDIDDASLAAAKLLCNNGRDMATADGWWGAIMSYNEVRPYANAVYAAANDYGVRSRNGP